MIQLTGIASRVVGYATAVILVALGLLPKLGALVAVMPPAVLGGATVVLLFGLVAMAGVRIVAQAGLSGQTMLILAVACGLGLGVETVPGALVQLPEAWRPILGSPLIVGTMTALILNLVFPPESDEDA